MPLTRTLSYGHSVTAFAPSVDPIRSQHRTRAWNFEVSTVSVGQAAEAQGMRPAVLLTKPWMLAFWALLFASSWIVLYRMIAHRDPIDHQGKGCFRNRIFPGVFLGSRLASCDSTRPTVQTTRVPRLARGSIDSEPPITCARYCIV